MGVGTDGRRLHDQAPVEHDGSPHHAGAGLHPDRFGLTRHGAHIDSGTALDHQTVSGDGLPGPDHETLLLVELLCGNDHFGAVGVEHRHILGAQRRQCSQCAAGL